MNQFLAHPTAVIDNGAHIGNGTRIWHFTHVREGASIGNDCTIGQNCYIASRAVIGHRVKIQNNVSIYDLVTIEDNVFIGPSAVFINDLNPRAPYPKQGNWIATLIKEGATVGANATILCGTTIGRWAFVGCGAVVTRDVPDYAMVKGNPAQQDGWICECGTKLLFSKNRAVCPSCNRTYVKERTFIKQEHAA
jgi:UDP-2-acetamido-3-amino-2,3-dideoxy-glucuronate N-acetyltransferase